MNLVPDGVQVKPGQVRRSERDGGLQDAAHFSHAGNMYTNIHTHTLQSQQCAQPGFIPMSSDHTHHDSEENNEPSAAQL